MVYSHLLVYYKAKGRLSTCGQMKSTTRKLADVKKHPCLLISSPIFPLLGPILPKKNLRSSAARESEQLRI